MLIHPFVFNDDVNHVLFFSPLGSTFLADPTRLNFVAFAICFFSCRGGGKIPQFPPSKISSRFSVSWICLRKQEQFLTVSKCYWHRTTRRCCHLVHCACPSSISSRAAFLRQFFCAVRVQPKGVPHPQPRRRRPPHPRLPEAPSSATRPVGVTTQRRRARFPPPAQGCGVWFARWPFGMM